MQLHISTSINGLVRTGVIERARSQRILSGLAPPIADNAVIVDLNGTPNVVRPGIALGLGTLLAFLAFWPRKRERSAARPGDASALPSGLTPPVLPAERASSQFDPELAFDELPHHAPVARPDRAPRCRSRVAAALAPARARCLGRARGDRDGAAARFARRGRGDSVRRHSRSRRRSPARGPGASRRIDQDRARPRRPGAHGRARGARRGWRRARQRGAVDDRLARVRAQDGLFVSAADLEALAALAGEGPVV